MKKSHDWIIASQEPGILAKHPGPVVWVMICLRCGAEQPVYEGDLTVAIFAAKEFEKWHKNCEAIHP